MSSIEERAHLRAMYDNPEVQRAIEEQELISRNRKLTDNDIATINDECDEVKKVYLKGLDIFHKYFNSNILSNDEITYLETLPFSGLISDNLFSISVLDHFNDEMLNIIVENAFGDTISTLRSSRLYFDFTNKIQFDSQYKDLIKHILKVNFQQALIKRNSSDFIYEIEALIELVYTYNKDSEFITDNEKRYFEEKKERNKLDFFSFDMNQQCELKPINKSCDVILNHFQNTLSRKLYLVEILEILLAYKVYEFQEASENQSKKPIDFNQFIHNDLLTSFSNIIYDIIGPLNDVEIHKFLTISLQQFETHRPENRHEEFLKIYHDIRWFPNSINYNGTHTYYQNYADIALKYYSTNYQLFIEATKTAFSFFENKNIKSDNQLNVSISEPTESINKFDLLKSNLYNNGFFELSKVKSLSHDGQSKIIELLTLNETPYNVAMFEFLGYFKYLTNELGYTNTKIHTKLSAFFNVDEQTFKCNMLVLNEKSKLRENIRYTAHLHKEKVKTDYNSLK